jgi:uroporphyrinogen-III synthase
MTAQPRVLITRSEDDCADWAERFAALGATAVSLPCIHCERLDTAELRAAAASSAATSDWLVFTSRRGVEAFAALETAPPRGRIATVGESTAAAARELIGRADLTGRGTAQELATELVEHGDLTHHPRVGLLLAANAGDVLERALRAAGASVGRLDVYRTIPAPAAAAKRAMSSLGADNVLFASPSAVTGFVHQVALDVPVSVFTIGPSTTAAARAAGLGVTAEAREPSFEGLLEAMQWRR